MRSGAIPIEYEICRHDQGSVFSQHECKSCRDNLESSSHELARRRDENHARSNVNVHGRPNKDHMVVPQTVGSGESEEQVVEPLVQKKRLGRLDRRSVRSPSQQAFLDRLDVWEENAFQDEENGVETGGGGLGRKTLKKAEERADGENRPTAK